MEQSKTQETTELEAIVARATREADLAMAMVTREGVDAVVAAIEAAERAQAEPIGWRASWFNSMVEVRAGVRVVVTLDDGREVSLDRSHARMLGAMLTRLAEGLPRGSEEHEEHIEMVLGLCG
jgi:hypothetical protein